MRKKSPGDAAPTKQESGAPQTVDEYMNGLSEPALGKLVKMRALIRSVVPAEATEIISYGIPAFKHKKVLVWFAAFSNHCSLFPTAAVVGALKDELKGLEISKGTIQFPMDKPLPAALIKRIVKTRLDQLDSKHGEGKLKPARKSTNKNGGKRQ